MVLSVNALFTSITKITGERDLSNKGAAYNACGADCRSCRFQVGGFNVASILANAFAFWNSSSCVWTSGFVRLGSTARLVERGTYASSGPAEFNGEMAKGPDSSFSS